MSYSKIISHNSLYMLLGRLINFIISALLIALITRYLGVSGFGQFATILSYIALFGVLSDFGIHNTITRKIATQDIFEDEISRYFIFKIILTALMSLLSVIIAWNIGYEMIIKIGITIFSIAGVLMALFSFNSALFHGKLKVKQFTLADVLGRAAILVCVFYSVKNDFGLLGIIISYIIGDLVSYLLSLYWLSKFYRLNARVIMNWENINLIIKESFPLGVIMILTTIYFRGDLIILSLLKPSYDVGIYGSSVKIIDIVLSFPIVIMAVIYPVMATLSRGKKREFNHNLQNIINFFILLVLPIVGFGIATSSKIVRLVVGSDFVTSSTVNILGQSITTPIVLSILLLSILFIYLHQVFSFVLIASGKQNILLVPVILYAIFNVSLNLIFVSRYSYFASSVITLINEAIVLLVVYKLSNQLLGHRVNFNIIKTGILSLIPPMGFIIIINHLSFDSIYTVIWQLLGAMLLYVLMLINFKVFNLEDIKKLI